MIIVRIRRNCNSKENYFQVELNNDFSYHNNMDINKDISYEEFEEFIKIYFLQSLKELNEMDSEDYERNSENDREGIILNTEENIMTNVNMIIEDIDKKEIDKIFG